MTDLTVSSDDLASFMGAEVDDDRADLFIELAMDQAEAVVSPVPEAAKAIILRVAARAYSNPIGVSQELVGPYQFSGAHADILLTKADRSALRRLAGGSGAFMVDPLGVDGTGSDTTDYPGSRFPTT